MRSSLNRWEIFTDGSGFYPSTNGDKLSDLRTHAQQLPGNKGLTSTPTAAVVLALFAQVALVQLWVDEHEVTQIFGVQPYHLLVCDALGLDSSWYEASSAQKNGKDIQTP